MSRPSRRVLRPRPRPIIRRGAGGFRPARRPPAGGRDISPSTKRGRDIGLLTANFLWDQKVNLGLQERGGYILVGAFSLVYAVLGFHLINRPTNVDFLIATDSEMKKVNWTSKKDLVGSTRVVILFMFVVAVLLFIYDLFFHTIFYLIGVLKTPPFFFPQKH